MTVRANFPRSQLGFALGKATILVALIISNIFSTSNGQRVNYLIRESFPNDCEEIEYSSLNVTEYLTNPSSVRCLYLGGGVISSPASCSAGITGTIPTIIGNLTHLRSLTALSLSGNEITGTIPTELGDLTNLKYLGLAGNKLNGTIPSELGRLTSLTNLVLANNQISGTIPSEIFTPTLNSLDVSGNKLIGSIPKEIAESPFDFSGRFQGVLDVANNQLSGTIPSEFSHLTKLGWMFLSNNQLSGNLPEFREGCNLIELKIENNLLNGSIYSSRLEKCNRIEILHMGGNALTGPIDNLMQIGYGLFDLKLDHNQLSGEIPNEIAVISRNVGDFGYGFNFLDLSHNFFTGLVPNVTNARGQWDFSYNNLLVEEVSLRSLSTFNGEIVLEGNNFSLPFVCDADLLSWFYVPAPKFPLGRRIQCEDTNIYGEYGFLPYFLRDDDQAPETHAVLLPEHIITTPGSILVKWSYEGNVPQSDITLAARSMIKDCKDFKLQAPVTNDVTLGLGFMILWKTNRICFLSDELQQMGHFGYNVTTDIIPATNYEIRIQPFYVQAYQFSAKLFFGIQSKTLKVKTNDDKPSVGPSNIVLSYRSDASITLLWDPIPIGDSNGRVIGYIVECEECESKTFKTRANSISINGLGPSRNYRFYIKAETTAGEGPPSRTEEYVTCIKNTYSLSTDGVCDLVLPGYFILESSKSAVACSSFADEIDQESCVKAEGNLKANGLVLRNGYWRPNVDSVAGIKVCPNPDFCAARNNESSSFKSIKSGDGNCASSHTGVYCSDCLDGYTMSNSGCVMCSSNDKQEHRQKAITFVVFIVLAIILYILRKLVSTFLNDRDMNQREGQWGFQRIIKLNQKLDFLSSIYVRHISAKFKIFVVTMQILISFQISLATKSPGNTSDNIFTTLLRLDLDGIISALEIHCFSEVNFYQRLLFITLFPLAVVLFTWLVYFTALKKIANQNMRTALYQKIFSFVLLITFLVFEPVSQTIVQAFLCETIEFESGDELYLRADHRLSCDSKGYRAIMIYAIWMFIVYPVGILCLYFGLLQNRRKLFIERMKTGDNSASEELKLVDFLTNSYKDNYYWFEIYELFRRLLMTSVVSVVVAHEDLTGKKYIAEAYAFCLVVFCILTLEATRPYKYKVDWLYALLSLIILGMATQISLWSEFQVRDAEDNGSRISEKSEYETRMYVFLFWLQIFLFLFFIIIDFALSKRKSEGKENQNNAAVTNTSHHPSLFTSLYNGTHMHRKTETSNPIWKSTL